MEGMNLALDVFALGCGAYILYTWLRLAVTRTLFQNAILVPKEKRVQDCLDEEGYIAAIRLPLAVSAVVSTLYGVFMVVNEHVVRLVPSGWSFAALVLVLGSLIWLAAAIRRAVQEYF